MIPSRLSRLNWHVPKHQINFHNSTRPVIAQQTQTLNIGLYFLCERAHAPHFWCVSRCLLHMLGVVWRRCVVVCACCRLHVVIGLVQCSLCRSRA